MVSCYFSILLSSIRTDYLTILVAKSKLDPKHSVNNRIKKLEDSLTELQELVNSHRQALEAIPARIKKIIPSDMNSQLARLSTMMDNFEKVQSRLSDRSDEVVSREIELIVPRFTNISILRID